MCSGIWHDPIRVGFSGAVHHIMARGNERRTIFRDDRDRERFLQTVEYLHFNPVRPRHKIALIPVVRRGECDRYVWSSHWDYAAVREFAHS